MHTVAQNLVCQFGGLKKTMLSYCYSGSIPVLDLNIKQPNNIKAAFCTHLIWPKFKPKYAKLHISDKFMRNVQNTINSFIYEST